MTVKKAKQVRKQYAKGAVIKEIREEDILPCLQTIALNGLRIEIESSRMAQFGIEKNIITCAITPERWCMKAKSPMVWSVCGEGDSISKAIIQAVSMLPDDITEDTVFMTKEIIDNSKLLDPGDQDKNDPAPVNALELVWGAPSE